MSIAADFTAFKDALISENTKVTTDSRGNWHELHRMKGPFTDLACFEQTRWISIAKNMVKELDRIEKIPVKFNGACDQHEMFKEHLEAAQYIKKQLKAHKTSKKVRTQWNKLRQRMEALRYRIEASNGGADRIVAAGENVEELVSLAVAWKEKYPLYQDTSISDSERQKLVEAASYPKFAKLLKIDAETRNQFFRWVIRDNISVDTFVQFPSTCMRLKFALISGRVGRFAKHFRFVSKESGQKEFRLPFQIQENAGLATREISILDESRRLNLRGNYELSIRDIINVFKNKNDDPGKLEFLGTQGIGNWHSHELGHWNPEAGAIEKIDISVENSRWWELLPEYEHLSLAEAKARYGIDELQQRHWVAVAKSTRESLTLDIDRSHGYFEILVPDRVNGGYQLFPLGKFAKEFPKSIIEKFLFVTNTLESRIEFPDENPFYSHRQQASAPFVIEDHQGLELMEMIRKDLKAAREGNVVFQFAWENCAWWPQQRLEELLGPEDAAAEQGRVPNLFVDSAVKSKPKAQPLKFIFAVCRRLPECIQNTVVRIVAFLLGSFRGKWVEEEGQKVFKSMKTSQFEVNCEMYHPAMLHDRIQGNTVPGVVTFGHHFLPQYA